MRLSAASRFRGRFSLPGDKSLCHRLAILGALAGGESRFGNFSTAADCDSTLRCLALLGVDAARDGGAVIVRGAGAGALVAPPGPLPAGNSGSTLRMLAGVLAGRPFPATITGDASLCRRPVERVARPLRAMGARVDTVGGHPPLVVHGGSLHGVDWPLEVPSAQVKTAILFAGLQAEGSTRVREDRPSRDHTERLLPAFGVAVEVAPDGGLAVHGRTEPLRPLVWDVPGDVSSAAFLVVAALIRPDSMTRIEGVLLNPGRTAFLEVLRRMGAAVEWGVETRAPEPIGWIEARSSKLRGTDVAPELVPALIDEVPALAVAAACAEGTTRFTGAAELRVKESDRIAAIAEGLQRMGAHVVEQPDGLAVTGGARLHGAEVRSHGDHRIAMALAVAALAAEGDTRLQEAACAEVSFPEFYEVLRRGVEGA